MTRRVVITGMGGVTAFGEDWPTISRRLRKYENAVRTMTEWQAYDGLQTLLAAPIEDFTLPAHYTRKRIRAMGRVSLLSTRATELALEQAGLIDDAVLTNGQTGIAYGSSTGSTGPVSEFASMLTEKHTHNITGTTYVQMMPHTTAVNTGLFFGLRGRVIPTSSACTSGSQAIGYAWEAIRHGYQTVMVAGGAEELCPSEAAVFDTLFATSQRNDAPKTTPSPFDVQRDGLVIGEGAGTLVLEALDHARARGATIYGEIVGFATNCDAAHITQPQRETMQVYGAVAGDGGSWPSGHWLHFCPRHGNRSRGYRRESGDRRHFRRQRAHLILKELFRSYPGSLRRAGSLAESAHDAGGLVHADAQFKTTG